MRRLLDRLVVVVAAACGCGFALAQDDPAGETVHRRQLTEQRRAIEASHAARQAECRQRFIVSECLERARDERRSRLADVTAQEAALDDVARQRRAAARQERISAKAARRAAEQRDGAGTEPLLPMESASAVRQRREPTPVAPREPRKVPDPAERRTAEDRARAATARREQEAQERRDVAAQRAAERQHKGKPPAAPLPPVPGASAP